jgi:hypothetical protein
MTRHRVLGWRQSRQRNFTIFFCEWKFEEGATWQMQQHLRGSQYKAKIMELTTFKKTRIMPNKFYKCLTTKDADYQKIKTFFGNSTQQNNFLNLRIARGKFAILGNEAERKRPRHDGESAKTPLIRILLAPIAP